MSEDVLFLEDGRLGREDRPGVHFRERRAKGGDQTHPNDSAKSLRCEASVAIAFSEKEE